MDSRGVDHRCSASFYGIWELAPTEWDELLAAAEADPDPWAALMATVDKFAADAAEPIMAGLLVEVIAQAHRDPEFAAGLAENDRRQPTTPKPRRSALLATTFRQGTGLSDCPVMPAPRPALCRP
jgi:hypothetical protein